MRAVAASFFVAFVLMMSGRAMAADVRAAVSQDAAEVGEGIELQIVVEGGRPSGPPADIQADGLQISYSGTSQSAQFSFGAGGARTVNRIIYSYQVVAQRAGNFTIPAVDVDVDGRVIKTRPVSLRIQDGERGAQGGGGLDKISFAEIVLPKHSAYVGETLPVEVRLYVDTRVAWQPETMPDFATEGFTKAKMPEPRSERAHRDGHDYDVLVFQTAITPTKAGKVRLGPASIQFHAKIPRAKANRPRNMRDFFGNDFFNDPFGSFGAVEKRKAVAEAVDIDVKPLPSAGKPVSFSGAVGNFSITAEGSPKEVKIGDPLTMKMSVTGQGNFDRMSAPVLKDTKGWRTYPPSSNFQPDDNVGFRGTKNFEVAVIPEARKKEMPQFEFSYFDPGTEKYVTLSTEAAPLKVTGEPAPPPVVKVPDSSREAVSPAPSTPPPAAPQPADILGIRYDAGPAGTWKPLYQQPWFWGIQLVPLLLVGGMLGRGLWKRNADAERLNTLRSHKQREITRLHRAQSRADFLEAAVHVIQLETASRTGQEAATVDAPIAGRTLRLEPEEQAVVEELFAARAELLYAGHGAAGGDSLAASERERFLAAVAPFERSRNSR